MLWRTQRTAHTNKRSELFTACGKFGVQHCDFLAAAAGRCGCKCLLISWRRSFVLMFYIDFYYGHRY